MTARRVVIIGAARSGTKLLRDCLSAATGAGAVPYDIGYVWRVGQEASPHDRLDPNGPTERQLRFIRRYVDRCSAGEPPAVVEKSVGNTLRVPLVARALPDAVFVHLVRDGVDVVESTLRQWTAPTDMRYVLAKARTVPLRLAPRAGAAYARSLVGRSLRPDRRVGSWGPRYPGIDDDLGTANLLTVCARQWGRCVTTARDDLAALAVGAVEVRYEQLVDYPAGVLSDLARLAGLTTKPSQVGIAVEGVVRVRQGRGRRALSAEQLQTVEDEVGPLLQSLDYPPALPLAGCEKREEVSER